MAPREEIAVIGAGLGGCLTALMLAKNPRYHVTLIEAQDTLLNGASAIASRLHLGGEYPLDPQTAQDCLMGAVIWKLLMPNHGEDERQENILTPTPPMKFLVAKKTEEFGRKNAGEERTLTLDKYVSSYEKIRLAYRDIFERVKG
jgi:glycine/D-amino acid oxidase-like deaminating enzyme